MFTNSTEIVKESMLFWSRVGLAQFPYQTGAAQYRNCLSMRFCEAIFCLAFRRREDFAKKKKTHFDFTAPCAGAGPFRPAKRATALSKLLFVGNGIPR